MSLVLYSCVKDEPDASLPVEFEVNDSQTSEEFAEYLKSLARENGWDTPQNPDLSERSKGESTLRGCAPDCDFDILDCGFNCDDPQSFTDTVVLFACDVEFTYQITACEDGNGNYIYYEVELISSQLLGSCPHYNINVAFDINYTGSTKQAHDHNNNLITGYILNYIEENAIYGGIIKPNGYSGFGNITSIVEKSCYAFCGGDQRYKECGKGCCVRYTQFEAFDGEVPVDISSNISNATVGYCTENVEFECSTTASCDQYLDCEIGLN